jgi:cytochrome P450
MKSNVDPSKEKYLEEIPGTDSVKDLIQFSTKPFDFFHERFNQYGEIFRAKIGFPCVFLIGNEGNRTIHVTQRKKFSYERAYMRLALGQIFKGSLIMLDGEEHKKKRSMLTPAVGRLALRKSASQVQYIWDTETEGLDDGLPRDCYYYVQPVTYTVSANALTGIELGDELEELRPHFENLIDGAMTPIPWRIPFGKLDRGLKSRDFLLKRLEEKVHEVRGTEEENPGLFHLVANDQDDNGNYLSPEEVARDVLLLFWAGYDTTASAGSWCVHLLAQHPEWQHKLREEAFEVLGDRDFNLKDVGELEQLGYFLREQERHRPSIIVFARETTEDVEFKNYLIPKGTQVMYSPYMSNHVPWDFENPGLFDPGRWDPNRGEKQAKASNLFTFGGGPRLCLGRNFALMQLRIMITTMLRKYVIEPDEQNISSRMGLPMHRPVNSKVYFRKL